VALETIMTLLKPSQQPRKRKKNHSIRNKRRTKRGYGAGPRQVGAAGNRGASGLLYVCQRCSAAAGEWDRKRQRPVIIQWAHIHTREYYITRWEPDNSLALCDCCHVWLDQHKVLGFDWFAKKYNERWERLQRILQGNCKTTDAQIREMWLENCGRENGD
jgi:hypothetical protein